MYLKIVRAEWNSFINTLNEVGEDGLLKSEKVIQLIEKLSDEIKKQHEKKLFPYNPTSLIKNMEQVLKSKRS